MLIPEATRVTSTRIPTEYGDFQLCFYNNSIDDKEHLALFMGDVSSVDSVLVRVHSECFTGDVLGSRRCDCGEQLDRSLAMVAEAGIGVVLYMRQEGRGIGLLEKLRAYNLQDKGYDTVDANLMLGHGADERDYSLAALILKDLQVRAVRLATNNPAKIRALEAAGITVSERVSLAIKANSDNVDYLLTKAQRMDHFLPLHSPSRNPDAGSEPLNLNQEIEQWLVSEQAFFHTSRAQADTPRPHLTLSYAQSWDGSITTAPGTTTLLSSDAGMQITHQLRSLHDGILVGIGTVLADDPRLTVREWTGDDPQPIVLDSQLRIPSSSRLCQGDGQTCWVLTTQSAASPRDGCELIVVPGDEDGHVNLHAAMRILHERGIRNLMVEGGASVITAFMRAGLADAAVLTVAPVFIGGYNAIGTMGKPDDAAFPTIAPLHSRQLGNELIVWGRLLYSHEKRPGSGA